MGWRRLAGRGRTADGGHVIWSMAEGTRGTRWRESVSDDADWRHALLLEVAPTGRIVRLEIAGPAGLLTLHPDTHARALHGNVVTLVGMVHIDLPWDDDALLLVPGSPTALSVALERRRAVVAVGERMVVSGVAVGADLRPAASAWAITREGSDTWTLLGAGDGPAWTVAVGHDPGPVLSEAEVWPLEQD